jgi:drug/metabolite transporter (DMT)-like permease
MMMLSVIIMVCSALLAALSQVLLKLSANKKHGSFWEEYLNVQVIVGYGLLLLTMFMNIFAYRGIEYKFGPILNSLSYVFVAFFGMVLLKEKLSKQKAIGLIMIILGVVVFNL